MGNHGEQHLATRPRRCDVDGEASRQHIDGQGAKQRRRPRRHDKMMLVKMTWRMVNTYINIYLYIYIMMMIWWMIWYMFFNGDMVNDMAIPYRTHCLRKEGGYSSIDQPVGKDNYRWAWTSDSSRCEISVGWWGNPHESDDIPCLCQKVGVMSDAQPINKTYDCTQSDKRYVIVGSG